MNSTVLASKSSWMQRQAEPLQCDRGAGRIRHIATPTLWLRRLVINGDIKMTRVGGNDNCADLGTKHLDYQDHEQTLAVLWNAFCRRSDLKTHEEAAAGIR